MDEKDEEEETTEGESREWMDVKRYPKIYININIYISLYCPQSAEPAAVSDVLYLVFQGLFHGSLQPRLGGRRGRAGLTLIGFKFSQRGCGAGGRGGAERERAERQKDARGGVQPG